MTDAALIRVALPVPLPGGFDYLCPSNQALPALGARVRVPFGRGRRVGVVIAHPEAAQVDPDRLKAMLEPIDAEPLLDTRMLRLLEWAAAYYHHPIGEVLSHALPAYLREGRPLVADEERPWRLTAPARAAFDDSRLRRAPRQAAAIEIMAGTPSCSIETLRAAGIGPDVLRRLKAKHWIERAPAIPEESRAAEAALANGTWPELTHDQLAAVDAIEAAGQGFAAHLVHGVTGSGKTEVYMRLIRRELERGRQSLLLVPEIALTPQMLGRLKARFGERLDVLHSGLADTERFRAWRRARSGAARVVVGTRSAIFASLPELGLIVIDEEHDPSFKQHSGFRYSARDLALVRAQQAGIKVVLGSATPCLESLHNARRGRLQLHQMPERIGRAGEPDVSVIDLRQHASRQGLSTPLVSRMQKHLADGNQVLLFLNRRGFAPVLFCPACEQSEDCDRCDARLTVHAKAGRLRCHHCGLEKPLQWGCPVCGAERLAVGAGTQRVTEELHALFPDLAVARLDRDVTARRGALDRVLDDVASGATRILVGTQMLTKGHDFPGVTLVGILNADQGLFGTDFRSDERLAQTIVQVAGRAGRREVPGEVLIQTHYPGHPLLQCLIHEGYSAFAELALRERELAGWPPFSHIAVIRAQAPRRGDVFSFLNRVRKEGERLDTATTMLGPASDPMERRSGRYFAQLLLRSATRGPLHETLSALDANLRTWPETRRVRWAIDVDPIEV